jgi:hypothetical protein
MNRQMATNRATNQAQERPPWLDEFGRLVDHYTERLGVTKGSLATALGVGSDFSPTSFSGPYWRARAEKLVSSLSADALGRVAGRLGLRTDQYSDLEEFFKEAVRLLQGWQIDPVASRGDRRLTVDWGVAGLELFDRFEWDKAIGFLEQSWDSFEHLRPNDEDAVALCTRLRVGTELLSLDSYYGVWRRTLSMIQTLLRLSRPIVKGKAYPIDTVRACGLFLTSAAVAFGHMGRLSGRQVIRYGDQAISLFADHDIETLGQIAARRDQAKPLLRDVLRVANGPLPENVLDEVLAPLDKADLLAGGKEPRDEYYETWLLTALNRIDCLAAAGYGEKARHLLDQVASGSRLDVLLKERRVSTLPGKLALTNITVCAALNREQELGDLIDLFLASESYCRFHPQRVNQLRQYLQTGNQPSLLRSLIS